MGWMSKIGWLVFTIVIIVALLYFFDEPTFCNTLANVMNPNISSKICGSQIYTNNPIIMKEQHNFTTAEIKAIAQSSPIAINPANAVFFGTWENMSHMLCEKEQALFTFNSSLMEIKYKDFYVPTIAELEAEYVPNSNHTNLIGQKVYLSFILNNNENVSAPYVISKIFTKGNKVYWIFKQDTGISNDNAVSFLKNITIQNLSQKGVNGVIFLNSTPLIPPLNPYIPYTAPSC